MRHLKMGNPVLSAVCVWRRTVKILHNGCYLYIQIGFLHFVDQISCYLHTVNIGERRVVPCCYNALHME